MLRFPEFQETEPWKRKRVDDENFATFHKGKGIAKLDICSDGKTPCIRYGELYTHYGEVIKTVLSSTNLPNSKLFFSRYNDVIIPSSGETRIDIATASCVMTDGAALGGDLNVIRSEQNGVFLSYYFNGSLKREIAKLAQGNAVVHLYISQLKKIELFLADLDEQQKVAACLSSIDSLIDSELQKLEGLQNHKKGLMQKLFPTLGKARPEHRFLEFKTHSDWEEKQLHEVCDINPSNDGVPEKFFYIDLSSVVDGSLTLKNEINKQDAPSRAQRPIKNGDVIYQIVRPYQKNNLICKFKDNHNYVASTGYAQLRAFGSADFLYNLISTEVFVGRVIANCTGSNYPAINSSDLAEIHIHVPGPEEQKKIANSFASLDGLIVSQSQKIRFLQEHKKSLLHQLFPSSGERAE